MALLQDLIQQIDDPALKERLLQETNKLLKQKKFGLVFEEHLPECTPLYDVPIRIGAKVALKTGYVSDIYTVLNINGDEVQCDRRETHEHKAFKLDELVTVAEFGEAIYPTLKPLDSVENAPDSGLWHTLIEADNLPYSFWSISTQKRWTAYILIRHTIPAQRTGNIITIMWIVLTLIAIANGSP